MFLRQYVARRTNLDWQTVVPSLLERYRPPLRCGTLVVTSANDPRSMIRFVTLLLVAALAAGCAQHFELGPPAGSMPITVDRDSYVLTPTDYGWETTIGFSFKNVSSQTVEIGNCLGAFAVNLEAFSAGAWEVAWSPIIPLCLSEPIVLAPGDSYEKELHVTSGETGSNVYPQFTIDDLDRPFRLNLVAATWRDQQPLPEPYRISAPFEIRIED